MDEQQHVSDTAPFAVPTTPVRIEVPLPAFTRRIRSVGVAHSDASLPRGLDLGEHVLLHDPQTRTYFTGEVADIDFTATDTHYRIRLGTRITSGEATQWLDPVRSRPAGGFSTRDVVELLAGLRRSQQGLLEAYRTYQAEAATHADAHAADR